MIQFSLLTPRFAGKKMLDFPKNAVRVDGGIPNAALLCSDHLQKIRPAGVLNLIDGQSAYT